MKAAKRRDIKQSVWRQVIAESMGVCAVCRTDIGGNGQIAHIVSPVNGPRSSDSLPMARRNDAANLIYVCRDTHWEVDNNEAEWSADRLRVMRNVHLGGRNKFLDQDVNWIDVLFQGDLSATRIQSHLANACAGQQLLLACESIGELTSFRNNLDLAFVPAFHEEIVQRLRDHLDWLLSAFDELGEYLEWQSGPICRVMFYSENLPHTFPERGRFLNFYGNAERVCAEAAHALARLRQPLAGLVHGRL